MTTTIRELRKPIKYLKVSVNGEFSEVINFTHYEYSLLSFILYEDQDDNKIMSQEYFEKPTKLTCFDFQHPSKSFLLNFEEVEYQTSTSFNDCFLIENFEFPDNFIPPSSLWNKKNLFNSFRLLSIGKIDGSYLYPEYELSLCFLQQFIDDNTFDSMFDAEYKFHIYNGISRYIEVVEGDNEQMIMEFVNSREEDMRVFEDDNFHIPSCVHSNWLKEVLNKKQKIIFLE